MWNILHSTFKTELAHDDPVSYRSKIYVENDSCGHIQIIIFDRILNYHPSHFITEEEVNFLIQKVSLFKDETRCVTFTSLHVSAIGTIHKVLPITKSHSLCSPREKSL